MSWNRCDRATFWKKDTRVDFNGAYYREQDSGRVDIKLKRKAVAHSEMPTNPTGWECLISADGETGKFGGSVVDAGSLSPRRVVLIIPGNAPAIYSP